MYGNFCDDTAEVFEWSNIKIKIFRGNVWYVCFHDFCGFFHLMKAIWVCGWKEFYG